MSDESKIPVRAYLWDNAGLPGWIDAEGEPRRKNETPYIREDVAQAMVAAAYEDIAYRFHTWGATAEAIRALTDDDARAALERVREKAREEGRREEREACAEIADGYLRAALKRVDTDPDDADRHEECASTAGSILYFIRARGKETK